VARGDTLSALRANGLRINRDGYEQRYALNVGSAQELGPHDLVIVATKSHDVGHALDDIAALLHAGTVVVSALNGLPWWFTQNMAGPLGNQVLESVDPGGRIANLIAPERSVGCVIHASVSRNAPGCVRIDKIDKLIFGEPSGQSSERVDWLLDAFATAGIRTDASPNIRMDTWIKLWGNMTMNPLSALTRAGSARVLEDGDLRDLCLRMMEEMAAVGIRIGLPFAMSANDRMAMTRKLGDFKTSMLQDLEAGADLEYEPQLGAVIEVALKVGVPTPFCSAVLGLVRQLSNSINSGISLR
jgi:2-dehydropantoate 2-reductase